MIFLLVTMGSATPSVLNVPAPTLKAPSSSCHSVKASQWGNLPRGGWRGAVLGPDGLKIFGIPTNASQVLEIDPEKRTVSTFGSVGKPEHTNEECSGTMHCGVEKWIGGVLAPNGKIIGIPYSAETVLEIDPIERTVTTFGVVSSRQKRKWVEGVLGRNGLIYAIPYDADVVLEINPVTHAMITFGELSISPCKWYGGVLAPNNKIYTIPYASNWILEIDPDARKAVPFAEVGGGWGKWAGGILAGNGKIYGVPALATAVLEIDPERQTTNRYGMLPGGNVFDDKWNGAVLSPQGRILGIPWRSSHVIEFDPNTKAIALYGNLPSSNFTWHGGAVTKNGHIIAVPYNSPWVLELGDFLCWPSSSTSNSQVRTVNTRSEQKFATPHMDTYALAAFGCPVSDKVGEDSCFYYNYQSWHSKMITMIKSDRLLADLRSKVLSSRLSKLPTDFCFLFNGQPLDPNVESSIPAREVATIIGSKYVVFIDNVNCNINREHLSDWVVKNVAVISGASETKISAFVVTLVLLSGAAIMCIFIAVVIRLSRSKLVEKQSYETVPIMTEVEDRQNGNPLHNKRPGQKTPLFVVRPPHTKTCT